MIKKSFICARCLLLRNYSHFLMYEEVIYVFICQVGFNASEIRGHLSYRRSKSDTFLASRQLQKCFYFYLHFSLITTLSKTFMEKQCL